MHGELSGTEILSFSFLQPFNGDQFFPLKADLLLEGIHCPKKQIKITITVYLCLMSSAEGSVSSICSENLKQSLRYRKSNIYVMLLVAAGKTKMAQSLFTLNNLL